MSRLLDVEKQGEDEGLVFGGDFTMRKKAIYINPFPNIQCMENFDLTILPTFGSSFVVNVGKVTIH